MGGPKSVYAPSTSHSPFPDQYTNMSVNGFVKGVEASGDFKVADMSLADFGRKEPELAEHEMPGLMSARAEFGPSQPLAGVRVMGSLHMTIQTGVLIETLSALGADVRWCSCNIFSTQDHAASGCVRAGTANIFAWKGETLEEYWWCTDKALTWPDGEGPDQIVDDGGDATLLLHEGKKFEEQYAKDGSLPDPATTDNAEFKCVLAHQGLHPEGPEALHENGGAHDRRLQGDHDWRPPPHFDGRQGRVALPSYQCK